jgi:hypothetical protein
MLFDDIPIAAFGPRAPPVYADRKSPTSQTLALASPDIHPTVLNHSPVDCVDRLAALSTRFPNLSDSKVIDLSVVFAPNQPFLRKLHVLWGD